MNARREEANARLPAGLSPTEEARWWDEHREYWERTETSDEVISPAPVRRTKPVNLRLPVDMVESLKAEATKHALPYQALIRMWLKERLNAEESGPER